MERIDKKIPYLHVSQKALLLCDELEKMIDYLWGLFGNDFEMLREMKTNRQHSIESESIRF
jgi:hypothetical protein